MLNQKISAIIIIIIVIIITIIIINHSPRPQEKCFFLALY